MVGLRLTQLPNPAPCFSPALVCKGFETEEKAIAEDQERVQRLRAYAGRTRKDDRQRTIIELARRLDSDLVPETMASMRYMREQRINIVGALIELLTSSDLSEARFVTLIPPDRRLSGEDLTTCKPQQQLAALRSRLNRCSATSADGWLMLFIDIDHDLEAKRYQFHLHGIAAGGMIGVVDALRDKDMFKRSEHVRNLVRLQQINDVGYTASYCLKAMACQRSIHEDVNGVIRRRSDLRRFA